MHWLKHSKDADNVDWVVILDADMIIRGPIIPWELGAEKGKPVAAYYGYRFLRFLFLKRYCVISVYSLMKVYARVLLASFGDCCFQCLLKTSPLGT